MSSDLRLSSEVVVKDESATSVSIADSCAVTAFASENSRKSESRSESKMSGSGIGELGISPLIINELTDAVEMDESHSHSHLERDGGDSGLPLFGMPRTGSLSLGLMPHHAQHAPSGSLSLPLFTPADDRITPSSIGM